jgi:hypothetical protein
VQAKPLKTAARQYPRFDVSLVKSNTATSAGRLANKYGWPSMNSMKLLLIFHASRTTMRGPDRFF